MAQSKLSWAQNQRLETPGRGDDPGSLSIRFDSSISPFIPSFHVLDSNFPIPSRLPGWSVHISAPPLESIISAVSSQSAAICNVQSLSHTSVHPVALLFIPRCPSAYTVHHSLVCFCFFRSCGATPSLQRCYGLGTSCRGAALLLHSLLPTPTMSPLNPVVSHAARMHSEVSRTFSFWWVGFRRGLLGVVCGVWCVVSRGTYCK